MVNFIEAINTLLQRDSSALKELAEHEANGKMLKLSIQMARLRTYAEQRAVLDRYYLETIGTLEILDDGPFLMVFYSSNLLPITAVSAEQLSDATHQVSEALGRTNALQTMDFSDVVDASLGDIPEGSLLREALNVYKDYETHERFLEKIIYTLNFLDEMEGGEKLTATQLQEITTPESFKLLLDSSIEAALQPLFEKERQPALERPYLNMEEAASYLKIAVQTLYGLTSRRAIPFIKRGKNNLFLKEELDGWIARGNKPSVEQMKGDVINKKRRDNL